MSGVRNTSVVRFQRATLSPGGDALAMGLWPAALPAQARDADGFLVSYSCLGVSKSLEIILNGVVDALLSTHRKR